SDLSCLPILPPVAPWPAAGANCKGTASTAITSAAAALAPSRSSRGIRMITPLSPASRSTVCSVQREQDCRRRASSHPLTGGIIVIEQLYIEGGRFAQIPMRFLVQDSAALAGGQLDLRRARHPFRLVGPQGRIEVVR